MTTPRTEGRNRGAGWRGRHLEVLLGKPAHGGFCIARHDGRVVFVRGGIPGERVNVEVEADDKAAYCRARVIDVIEPSPDRRASVCAASSVAGAGCCDLAHLEPSAAREFTAAVVREQLARIGGLTAGVDDVMVEPLPGDDHDDLHRRTRIRLTAGADGRFGYHRYRSEDVVADLRCPQPVSGLIDAVDTWTAMPGTDLVLVMDSRGTRHAAAVAPPEPTRRTIGRRARATGRRTRRSAPRPTTLRDGDGVVLQEVGPHTWELDPLAFWQAHEAAPRTYTDLVTDWGGPSAEDVVWDLYSGAGLFSAPLADAVGPTGRVEAVEVSRRAVAAGRRSLAEVPGLHFHCGDTATTIERLQPDPSLVVLDPPRSGAGRAVIDRVAAAAPRRVVHIGCDAAAFARDLALFAGHGYRPVRLRVFDAFPLTHHVECFAALERAD